MDIVQNILAITKAHNVTDQQLCKLLKTNPNKIYDWKKGKSKPSAEDISILADYLGCSIDYLLGRDKQEEKPTPVSGDGLDEQDRQLLELMKLLSADQKKFLLAQLLTLTGQGK